jgi:ubiquinone/menaquinone biosynthesis C-methylase UbiE
MNATILEIQNPAAFAEKYILLREREHRIYTDEEVARLPDIDSAHPHSKEWLLRKKSSDKILEYLQKKSENLNILEVGCGNGWLCGSLSKITNGEVIGSDINVNELAQAKRVFGQISNLRFMYGDIRSLPKMQFDVIVFSASIQYFDSIKKILSSALDRLTHRGEIHIIDTAFYNAKNVGLAKKRSLDYYTRLGFPDMAEHYFHHCLTDLSSFNYTILYNPFSLKNKLSKQKNPFYWIKVKNHSS